MASLPSLDERLQRLIEDCCGGAGGGDTFDSPAGDSEPPTADSGSESLIDRTLSKLKSKRKTRKKDGT